MSGRARHLFACGNTAIGPYSLYDSAFDELNQLFVLTGSPGTGKSTAMELLAEEMLREGHPVEFYHSPDNKDRIDGIILKDLNIGIVDGTAYPNALQRSGETLVREIYFDSAVAAEQVELQNVTIRALEQHIADTYQKAYEAYGQALKIHDEWEKIYIGSMRFDLANEVTEELLNDLFSGSLTGKQAKVRHLFLGAATPQGSVDFVMNLTEDAARRIFIKGRPGSGKSTMLKKLAAAAQERHYDVEIYHCGFDPNSLDMLIFPELSVAIFDSTAPHEHFPSRAGDEVLDMYERTMAPGTDEQYAAQLDRVKTDYRAAVVLANAFLENGYALRNQLKEIYAAAIDYQVVNQLQAQLLSDVRELTMCVEISQSTEA